MNIAHFFCILYVIRAVTVLCRKKPPNQTFNIIINRTYSVCFHDSCFGISPTSDPPSYPQLKPLPVRRQRHIIKIMASFFQQGEIINHALMP